MNGLYFNDTIQHRHSDYLIRIAHHKLEIDSDLEMRAFIRLEFWTKDENGEFDQPLLEVIQNDPNLSLSQKANDIEMFKTRIWSSTTRGSRVVPETGVFVYPDEAGNYPEGSITQLEYWQSLPAEAFPGTTLAQKVYAALLANMEEIYTLGNI
ncbi:hypothetical protein [Cyclobacterium marinum]|uniref:Uncharacterized protein n=1 Tax=Cyclobacterium marinum (strain ATCC 25205 / DSM 745 / LMG 13164 / NCIMB 1802) TaxID=880070 RepID=G0IZ90_CYCMS|nr:hypothetical protein [Cyclobacterium marinum]AEL24363.1 hypothetical protein Cycma_0588 [Cyclobacterium marinum DSM 745]